MIQFLTEALRQEFHLLPIERQKAMQDLAEYFREKGMSVQVIYLQVHPDGTSEIEIRIN